MNKNVLYFVVIVVLIIIFFLAGNNIMNLNDKVFKNEEVISNLNQKLANNNIIIKNLSNKNIVDTNKNVGVMSDPDWENKVRNHMNYPHGNPMMYDTPIRELYNDLK
jgi:hypothetical protein